MIVMDKVKMVVRGNAGQGQPMKKQMSYVIEK